ncbi:MAG: NAD(P)-dependent oxidoreductase [Bdellovibrionales bacterium]|jgi:nucleoside-diphosphate-sugar epimerase|nr:NAD(P)-dependent oxidoreductase [Bdellovibrionales bacterium]
MSLFAVGQSKMKALLTGGTGFVGQNLKNHLLAKGWVVENISRTDSSRAALDLVMARFRPDVVIHLATLFIAEHKPSDIPALIESNITFGTQVVDSMAQHQVLNLVNAGTLWQYYEGQREVPACLYAATKTAFESVLRFYSSAHKLRVINLMLSDTYGPKDPRQKLLPKLIGIAGTSAQIQLSAGEQAVAWTYISDVVAAFEVAALRLLSDKEDPCLQFVHYSATSPEALTLRESVGLCEEVLKKKINVEFGAKPYRQREVMKPFRLDPTLPGWSARISFAEGLTKIHGDHTP